MSFLEVMRGLLEVEGLITGHREAPGMESGKLMQPTEPKAEPQPISPIQPGWLIVWRDQAGWLRGGDEERARSTVVKSEYGPQGRVFHLSDGTAVPMRAITGVSKTDACGAVVAGWTVRAWGLNGEKGGP